MSILRRTNAVLSKLRANHLNFTSQSLDEDELVSQYQADTPTSNKEVQLPPREEVESTVPVSVDSPSPTISAGSTPHNQSSTVHGSGKVISQQSTSDQSSFEKIWNDIMKESAAKRQERMK